MKRFFILATAVFLAAAAFLGPMHVSSMQALVEADYTPSEKYQSSKYYSNLLRTPLTGNQILDIINVAMSQYGYHEGDCADEIDGSNPNGSHNYSEYGYWFGTTFMQADPFYTPWCAFFVSWCARQAQIPVSVINTSAYARVSYNPYHFHVTYVPASEHFPQCGDLIFYDFTGTGDNWSHVGIVLYVENGIVYTIEGNMDSCVSIQKHSVKSGVIRGYGLPEYTGSKFALDINSYPVTSGTIKPGAEGPEVAWAQCALLRLHYPVAVTSCFDEQTKEQVIRFQRHNGISTTGNIGPLTLAAIKEKLTDNDAMPVDPNQYPMPERTLSKGIRGEDVKFLQALLKRVGMDQLITGYFGSMTENNLWFVQRGLGLPATGICNEKTLQALMELANLEPGAAQPIQPTAAPTASPTATPAPTAAPNPTAAPTQTPSNPSYHDYPVPKRTLYKGCSGDDVKWLQYALKRLGHPFDCTGYFGDKTEKYVKWFQDAFGLPQTGIFDETSRIYMVHYLGHIEALEEGASQHFDDPDDPNNYPVPEGILSLGDSGNEVRWVQACLKRMGYDISVTGYFGPNTEDKLGLFQQRYGLHWNGLLDKNTRDKLKSLCEL